MVSSTNHGMRRIVVVRRAHYDNSGRFSVVPLLLCSLRKEGWFDREGVSKILLCILEKAENIEST